MIASAVKTQDEIQRMRTACSISAAMHVWAMSSPWQGLQEKDVEKKMNRFYKASLASDWAYPLIVGSGSRANVLHARPTNRRLRDGDLLLMDGGVKYEGICSDITRTWPVGKKFSKLQRQVYQIV